MKEDEIIITPLLKAKKTLEEALSESESKLERDGAIQRFEYCYELAWKTMKRILNARGIEVNSPKATFREAVKEKLISDPEIWFEFMEMRNLTSHTYNEDIADEIFVKLKLFAKELDKFVKQIQK